MTTPAFAVLLFALFTTLATGFAYWMARTLKGERAGRWAAAGTFMALVALGAGLLAFVRALP
jgi:hypothetical protein